MPWPAPLLRRAAPARDRRGARGPPARAAAGRTAGRPRGGRARARHRADQGDLARIWRCCWSSTTSIACSPSPTHHRDERGQGAGRGRRGRRARPPAVQRVYIGCGKPHARRARARRGEATRRSCASRQSTPSTARATSCTTCPSTCARTSRCAARTQRRGQVHLAEDILGIVAARAGLDRAGRRRAQRDALGRRSRASAWASCHRAGPVRGNDGGREPRARASRAGPAPVCGGSASASSTSSRASGRSSLPRRTSFPAASSRWWRSRARCPATCASCCWTSPSRGCRRRWWRKSSTLRKLRREISILIIEHHLDLALAFSDRTVALERGEVQWTGNSKVLRDDLELRRKVLWL